MNGQEYLQAVRDQFEKDGWQVQSKQLDSDVVLLQGNRSGGTALCMVVNGEASGAHVQRLVEFAQDAGAGTVAIAAKNGYDTAARTVIDQHGIRTVEIDGGGTDTDGGSSREVSRRTAVLAIGGSGVLAAGGFYVASGGASIPGLGGGIGTMPVANWAPATEEFSVDGSATPTPPEEGADEIEYEVTATSLIDEDRTVELVAITFVAGDGTILSDVEIREERALPAGSSVMFGGTVSVENPPDWTRASGINLTFRVGS